MPAARDLTGQRFNRWLVLRKGESKGESRKRVFWICRCDCGTEAQVYGANLTAYKSRSCGCYHKEQVSSHGMAGTPVYQIYQAMKQRCQNPKASNYAEYGGRGIKLCERWDKSFENFYADMEARPSSLHSVDRKDPNGDYEPDNCRWALPVEQSNNRRNNRFITFRGETKTAAEWARWAGTSKTNLLWRLKSDWPLERALTTPSSH